MFRADITLLYFNRKILLVIYQPFFKNINYNKGGATAPQNNNVTARIIIILQNLIQV